jgi:hypothetical protein
MPEQYQSQNLSYNVALRSIMILGLGKHKQMIEMKGEK